MDTMITEDSVLFRFAVITEKHDTIADHYRYQDVTAAGLDYLNSSNMSVTEDSIDKEKLLIAYLGEKSQDLPSVIVLTIVYCIIFVTGVVGNVSTCVVIARNNYMHTVTNYYLFSLAVSDMLTLVLGLPPELYSIWEAYPWRFGEEFCIFKSFLSEMTSYSSVLVITAFTVERYVAICHPIKSQTLSNLPRAVKIICSIWIIAAIFALPYPITTRVFPYVQHDNVGLEESLVCNISPVWQAEMIYAFQLSTFVFFILPMAVITVMYILIGRSLSRSEFTNSSQISLKCASKTKAKKAVIKMLVAVVAAFFFCWAPFNAQRLMTTFITPDDWTPFLMDFQGTLFYISGVLYFFGSTVNPILYNLISKKFRIAFKRTLCRCCYSVEELFELSGRSKSVLYSDRSPSFYRSSMQITTNLSRSPILHKSKSGSALIALQDIKTGNVSNHLRASHSYSAQWNGALQTSKWRNSSSENRWYPTQRCHDFTSISLQKGSSMTSVMSFSDFEQDILVEVNSSGSQSKLVNNTHLRSLEHGPRRIGNKNASHL